MSAGTWWPYGGQKALLPTTGEHSLESGGISMCWTKFHPHHKLVILPHHKLQKKKKSHKSSQRLYRTSVRDCLLCSPWMHSWCFIITSNSHISATNAFCHVILLYISGAVLKNTQIISLLWKMLIRQIITWLRWAKKTMEVYARWRSIVIIFNCIFSPVVFWESKF